MKKRCLALLATMALTGGAHATAADCPTHPCPSVSGPVLTSGEMVAGEQFTIELVATAYAPATSITDIYADWFANYTLVDRTFVQQGNLGIETITAIFPDADPWLMLTVTAFDNLGELGGPTIGFNTPIAPTPDPVPLPATLPLFATGLAGLGLLGWRRKKKAAPLNA